MSVQRSRPANGPSARQRSVRRHSRWHCLKDAVRDAVDVFFRFRYRASRTEALWSEAEHVWLGRETFLYWALRHVDIDVPWVVATAGDAPKDADDLRVAVRAALIACWTDRTRSLPRSEQPRWLPLP